MEFKDIQKNLIEQNNRATADPIFVVYDWEKVPSHPDYTDNFMFVNSEGEIAQNREKFISFLKDNNYDLPKELNEYDSDDLIKWLSDEGYTDFSKVYYIKKRIFINVFFTEKSADLFIEQNNYHYTKEVHTYVNCLWRNPEMQMIRKALIDGKFTQEQKLKGEK